MKQIPLKETAQEDVLARDLVNDDGAVILHKGTKLTASIISRLGKMNIETVCVRDADDEPDEKEQQELADLLKERFRGTDNDPFLTEMFKVAAGHIANS